MDVIIYYQMEDVQVMTRYCLKCYLLMPKDYFLADQHYICEAWLDGGYDHDDL